MWVTYFHGIRACPHSEHATTALAVSAARRRPLCPPPAGRAATFLHFSATCEISAVGSLSAHPSAMEREFEVGFLQQHRAGPAPRWRLCVCVCLSVPHARSLNVQTTCLTGVRARSSHRCAHRCPRTLPADMRTDDHSRREAKRPWYPHVVATHSRTHRSSHRVTAAAAAPAPESTGRRRRRRGPQRRPPQHRRRQRGPAHGAVRHELPIP